MFVRTDKINTVSTDDGVKVLKLFVLEKRFSLFGLEKYIPWAWKIKSKDTLSVKLVKNIVLPNPSGTKYHGLGPAYKLGTGWVYCYGVLDFNLYEALIGNPDVIVLSGTIPKGTKYYLSPTISLTGQEIAAEKIELTGVKYLSSDLSWAKDLIIKRLKLQ